MTATSWFAQSSQLLYNYLSHRPMKATVMEIAYRAAVWLHVGAGFITLILFWAQLVLGKGTSRHVWTGRVFLALGVLVAVSALYSILYQIGRVNLTDEFSGPEQEQLVFPVLLGFIALLVLVMLGYGVTAARMSRLFSISTANNLLYGAVVMMLSTVGLAVFTAQIESSFRLLLLAALVLGLKTAWDGVQIYKHKVSFTRNDWLAEHFRGMIGAGIAFHAAFGVFGMFRLSESYEFDSRIGIALVTLPILIGITIDVVFRRQYKTRSADTS